MRAIFGGCATVALVISLASCGGDERPGLGEPVVVSLTGGSTPTIAADPWGGSYVSWIDTADSLGNVYLAHLDGSGQRVGSSIRVNATPGDASTHEQAPPQVVVGPKGEVYVAWQASRSIPGRMYDASDLRFAYSADGGRSFGPTLTVNDDAGRLPSSHTFHDIEVSADGTVYVAWLDGREQDRARAEISGSADHGHGAAPSGQALPGSDIRIASWRPGDPAFSASRVIDRDVCPCCRVSIAMNGEGVVLIAWRKVFPGNVRDVVVARSEDGGATFSAPRVVHQDGWVFDGCPHAGPSVAFDEAGAAYVAWYTGKEGGQGLYFAVSDDAGRTFGDPSPLLTDEYVPPSQVKLAPAAEGVWASWDDRRTTSRLTSVAMLTESGARLAAAPFAGHSPSLASTGPAATLVWQEGPALRVRALRPE